MDHTLKYLKWAAAVAFTLLATLVPQVRENTMIIKVKRLLRILNVQTYVDFLIEFLISSPAKG